MDTVWTYIGVLVSFAIFVVILHRILYKPVGKLLKERKETMEAELAEAKKLREDAEQTLAEARKREHELEAKREGILKDTHEQAESERKEMLKAAEEQARVKIERFRRVMNQERDQLVESVTVDLRDAIYHVASAMLENDDEALSDRSIERVEGLMAELSNDDLKATRSALTRDGESAQVLSAVALNDEQQNRLKKIIADKLDLKEFSIEVKEDASLLAGLEVTLGHVNIAAHWKGFITDALKKEDSKS